jgi:hypothetical protein
MVSYSLPRLDLGQGENSVAMHDAQSYSPPDKNHCLTTRLVCQRTFRTRSFNV